MALRASALQVAVVVAIFVALVVCWAGEPAEGRPSCDRIHRCISKCPSKCKKEAASSCESAKAIDFSKCRFGCVMGCNGSCHQSGATTCDCDNVCDKYCKTTPGPQYNGCVSMVSKSCEDSCEKRCKGEKVNN